MKKLINGITSIACGVLMFILGVCPAFSVVTGSGNFAESSTLSFYDGIDKTNTAFQIFAIIMMIVAALLIIAGVVEVLKQLNILKIKFNISLINVIILIVLVVSMIGLTISALVYAGDTTIKNILTVSAGVGIWIMDIVAVAGLVVATLFKNKN